MSRSFEKAISVFLCAVLLAGVFAVCAFADDGELKITVATDTHYQCAADNGPLSPETVDTGYLDGLLNEDIYYYTTIQGQMNFESEAIVRAMLDGFIASDSEYLLIAGDLTCGKRQSHLEFAKLLAEAESKSGRKIFVVPGNHDCDDEDFEKYISIDEFKEIYNDFGFSDAIAFDTDSASYVAELDENYRLLAIDSCIYGADDGKLSDATLAWIEEQTDAAKADGKNVIAMMHHSLLSHFSVQPMFEGSGAAAEFMADLGIKYVFTGHLHANDISSATTKNGNTIYDVQTGCLISAPNAYREVSFTDSEVAIESKYVTGLDAAYLPDGYTDEQLSLIESDFPAYARGYFEAGMCKWLNRYIGSAGKVGKLLKQEPGTPLYAAIDTLMKNVGEAINLPIYDDGATPESTDSIEEVAVSYGFTIPASDYEKPYQVVAALMGAFYHGDEPASLKENELPLVYACLKAMLVRAIMNIGTGSLTADEFDALTEMVDGTTVSAEIMKGAANEKAVVDMAGAVASSLLYTLTDGIAYDYSEPEDINVTLPGYGAENESVKNGAWFNLIERIIKFFKLFLSFFGIAKF